MVAGKVSPEVLIENTYGLLTMLEVAGDGTVNNPGHAAEPWA
jgi:hypothetical protein